MENIIDTIIDDAYAENGGDPMRDEVAAATKRWVDENVRAVVDAQKMSDRNLVWLKAEANVLEEALAEIAADIEFKRAARRRGNPRR